MKASEWAFDRIKEAFELVAKDETEKMSIVIMLRSTDYLRRIIGKLEDKEKSQCHTCARTATVSLGRLRMVGLGEKNHTVEVCNLWRKVRLEASEQAFGRANWRKF